MKQDTQLPVYNTINEFLGSFAAGFKSLDPNLFCLRLLPNSAQSIDQYKAPHKKDFYFISCITNAGKTKISYEAQSQSDLQSFLVFQSPGLPYSFYRDKSAEGYIVYFKKECVDFFIANFEQEFPFFDLMHTHFYKLNAQKFKQLSTHFIDLFEAFNNNDSKINRLPAIKLLALIYELKNYTASFKEWENSFMNPAQLLQKRFIQMINSYYLEKRTVEEYAILLNVSANHLSQSIKKASGKNALMFITERIITEAKSLIKFTNDDIAEIAHKLDFSDNANFSKFFKKHIGLTPIEYRKQESA